MLTSFIDLSSYLERAVSRLTDPYEVAIVTYALTLANSPAKESAFNGLHKIKRESGKFEFCQTTLIDEFNDAFIRRRNGVLVTGTGSVQSNSLRESAAVPPAAFAHAPRRRGGRSDVLRPSRLFGS
jgi:hypothetical protein